MAVCIRAGFCQLQSHEVFLYGVVDVTRVYVVKGIRTASGLIQEILPAHQVHGYAALRW